MFMDSQMPTSSIEPTTVEDSSIQAMLDAKPKTMALRKKPSQNLPVSPPVTASKTMSKAASATSKATSTSYTKDKGKIAVLDAKQLAKKPSRKKAVLPASAASTAGSSSDSPPPKQLQSSTSKPTTKTRKVTAPPAVSPEQPMQHEGSQLLGSTPLAASSQAEQARRPVGALSMATSAGKPSVASMVPMPQPSPYGLHLPLQMSGMPMPMYGAGPAGMQMTSMPMQARQVRSAATLCAQPNPNVTAVPVMPAVSYSAMPSGMPSGMPVGQPLLQQQHQFVPSNPAMQQQFMQMQQMQMQQMQQQAMHHAMQQHAYLQQHQQQQLQLQLQLQHGAAPPTRFSHEVVGGSASSQPLTQEQSAALLKDGLVIPNRRVSLPMTKEMEDLIEVIEDKESSTKIFRCRRCNRTGNVASNMRRHIRSHLQMKPYPCRLCDRKFTNSDNRKKHEKQHLTNPQRHPTSAPRSQIEILRHFYFG
eukprot:m.135105 g.135105  ORF g.135105 m.135105 type:complete len:474 (+) comp13972_c1_seq3:130-1551(+)